MIKKYIFVAGVFATQFLSAQSLEYGFRAGTGSVNMIENSDNNVNIRYGTPVTLVTDLKYTPANSNFGILFRYQHTNSEVSGQKWFEFNQNFSGTVSDNSLFLILEYIKNSQKRFSFGANIGLGITNQSVDFNYENTGIKNTFASLQISGVAKYNITEKLSLKLEPGFQFADPISGLRSTPYRFAKEDIHFLTLLGISYRLN